MYLVSQPLSVHKLTYITPAAIHLLLGLVATVVLRPAYKLRENWCRKWQPYVSVRDRFSTVIFLKIMTHLSTKHEYLFTSFTGFYRLWHADQPCKMCYCSGHTFSCQVQSGWSQLTVSDRWSLLDQGILQPRWSVIDSQGILHATDTEIHHRGNDVQ